MTTASCQRVWLSLGGAGSETFTNIQTILNNGGTAATNLINNLVALATSLKALSGKITSVGFDMDNEDASPSAVVPLIVALYNKGISLLPAINFQFTFCPYTDEDDWCAALASVYSGLKGVQPVVGFNLQTYSGGAGNNPVTWTQSLANYLTAHPNTTGVSSAAGFILPILSMDNMASPTKTPAHMKADLKNWGSTGASFWATQALFQSNQTYTWKDYAAAIAAAIAS
ncbi:MAG TPA: hypothetical protein VH877_12065 [Polyangia bacterium]|nr:hypothetical protein [Polyangia bacterium]